MKKLLPLALSLLLLLSACSASSSNEGPVYKVKGGTFTCSAQELIDSINNATKVFTDFPQIAALPEYSDNTEIDHSDSTVAFEEYKKDTGIHEIEIAGPDLTMSLTEKEGKLYYVNVDWNSKSSNPDIVTEARILTSTLLTLLVPEPDSVQEQMSETLNKKLTGCGGTFHQEVDYSFNINKESDHYLLGIKVHKELGELPK